MFFFSHSDISYFCTVVSFLPTSAPTTVLTLLVWTVRPAVGESDGCLVSGDPPSLPPKLQLTTLTIFPRCSQTAGQCIQTCPPAGRWMTSRSFGPRWRSTHTSTALQGGEREREKGGGVIRLSASWNSLKKLSDLIKTPIYWSAVLMKNVINNQGLMWFIIIIIQFKPYSENEKQTSLTF